MKRTSSTHRWWTWYDRLLASRGKDGQCPRRDLRPTLSILIKEEHLMSEQRSTVTESAGVEIEDSPTGAGNPE
jgi:hypothetical protein